MIWLLFGCCVIAGLFGFVLLYGAPYLPTLKHQKEEALELLDLQPGKTLVELGSGDGRMLVAAAQQGVRAVGYELNPLLFVWSWLSTRKYRNLVTVRLGNFWNRSLPDCDGIYVFLLDRFMPRLDQKVADEIRKPVRLVSFAFRIPDKQPTAEKDGLYLYTYSPKK